MRHDLALLFFRVAFGGAMAFAHGLPKLMTFSEKSQSFGDPLGLGPTASLSLVIFAEFFCSLAVIVGFSSRLAAIPIIIAMSVAFGIVHADDPFGKKELPLLFACAFTFIAMHGAGKFSLDHYLARFNLSKPSAAKVS